MNATMTCKTVILNPVHPDARSFLSTLRRFFKTLLATNPETPFGLPADLAARVYL